MDNTRLKELVRSKYNEIASRSDTVQKTSCCEPAGCCGPSVGDNPKSDTIVHVMTESYDKFDGYQPEADLKLGCGIPVEYAGLKPGHSVLDLGSGAGNDLFVARAVVGNSGRLTGLDFSDTMIQKARSNAQKLGYDKMEFILGDIEHLPFDENRFDVVLSNCVLNLVPDKQKAFSEVFRVLKDGGHFSISDIVLEGFIPEPIRNATEAYTGCIAGAIQKNDYLEMVKKTGFTDVAIQKEREIIIPVDDFVSVLDENHAGKSALYQPDTFKVFSITLTGKKSPTSKQ